MTIDELRDAAIETKAHDKIVDRAVEIESRNREAGTSEATEQEGTSQAFAEEWGLPIPDKLALITEMVMAHGELCRDAAEALVFVAKDSGLTADDIDPTTVALMAGAMLFGVVRVERR